MTTNNRKLKLDFEEPSTLFLAYPEEVVDCETDYTSAKPVFDRIIQALPSNLNLVVFTKTARIASNIEKMRRKRTTTLVNSELSSIWLRDTAGFNLGSQLIKPIYKPRYYRKFFDEAAIIDSYSKIIHSILRVDMFKIPFIWDGGNLVTNGDVGFITDQILQDNKKTHSEEEVKDLIRSSLGIEPVIIPTFSDDPFAHTDGYMNFLDKDTLAIASYPKEWRKKEINYLKELKAKVRRHVKSIVELKENPVEEMNGSIFSAKGSYVNFLKLGKLILVPSFQDKEIEKDNYNLLKRYGKVIPINCNELSKFGGLLHCISFTN